MTPIEMGLTPNINHISENSENYIKFSAYSGYEEYKKEQIEYSYFKLEKVFGSRKAHFINRLIYWLSKCGRNINGLSGKWIYNSTHEWANQLNCSISTIKRLVKSLEEQGVITSKKVNAKRYNQTKWYSLNFNLLNNILNSQDTKDNSFKNKWTKRLVQNEPIIISNNRNNYTNTSSNEFKNSYSDFKEEDINFSNSLKESKAQQTSLTTDKNKLVEQMVGLWNKVFSYSISPIKAYVSKYNRKKLYNVLDNFFAGDLSEWQEYAKKVNSSQFLMGEKETKKNFRATFSWLIKPETIEKIINDEYGVGDRELDMNNVDKNIEQKKNDIINKMDKKVAEFIKNNINEEKERIDFKEYVKNFAHDFDSDEYGIMTIIKHIPYFSLFETEEYKGVKENLFESYIMKKYIKITKIEARKKLSKRVDELVKKEKNKYLVIKELIRKESSIEELIVNNENMVSELQKLTLI